MRRRELLGSGLLLLWLGPQQLAHGAQVLAVRIWPAQDYTRLTIESDTELKARQFFVADPPRLAVDIEGVDLAPSLRELVRQVKSDDPNVSGIRVGQNAPNVVRLVVDLKKPITPQVFSLPPVASYQNRLVVDLYPTQAIDPLDELIQQRLGHIESTLAAGPAATGTANNAGASTNDPLGELIRDRVAQANQPKPPAPVPTDSTAAASTSKTPRRPAVDGDTATAKAPAPNKPIDTKARRLIVVALDPGHGGEDPGATGPSGTREKDVVLQIAQRLRDKLQDIQVNGNPVQVYMTRDADFFVPLHVRVQKAQRVQADLFVSLHADAFYTAAPQGASVFALSERGASSAAARWMANKENSADAVGGLNVNVKDASVQRALFDMSTTAQIRDSLKLGGTLLGEIGRVGKLHKPQVEQASFAVLKAPDIPSILVETAFISNPEEEARLQTAEYQDKLAQALHRGIVRYFASNPPQPRDRQA